MGMPSFTVSIQELAETTNQWCQEHAIAPISGQAGERITARNIRYYRARGLIDAPGSAEGSKRHGFTDKHACQLRAIRLLQARGLPLEQIQTQLQGRSLEELKELERHELFKLNGPAQMGSIAGAAAQEQWQVTAVGGDFLLVSRRGRPVTEEQRRKIAETLGV
jgi:DNA-binding transcriptional MerR regulator